VRTKAVADEAVRVLIEHNSIVETSKRPRAFRLIGMAAPAKDQSADDDGLEGTI
jgi:hypothetical protein